MTATRTRPLLTDLTAGLVLLTGASLAQLVDFHDAPNSARSGIAKTRVQQIGAGRTRK